MKEKSKLLCSLFYGFLAVAFSRAQLKMDAMEKKGL